MGNKDHRDLSLKKLVDPRYVVSVSGQNGKRYIRFLPKHPPSQYLMLKRKKFIRGPKFLLIGMWLFDLAEALRVASPLA